MVSMLKMLFQSCKFKKIRGVKFEGSESVYAVEGCKIMFLGGGTSYSLVQTAFTARCTSA